MKKLRALALLLIVITITLGYHNKVFANSVDRYLLSNNVTQSDTENFLSNMKDYTSIVSITNENGTIFNSGSGSIATAIALDKSQFATLSDKEQKKLLEALVSTTIYNKIDDEEKIVFTNDLSGLVGSGSALVQILFGNSKPNFGKAVAMIRPFSDPFQTALGIAVILLSVAITSVIILDLTYLCIPFVRNKREEAENGLNWVSREAQAVMREADDKNAHVTQVLWLYLKVKAIMLFLFIVCILYLANGAIFKLFGAIIDLGEGLLL